MIRRPPGNVWAREKFLAVMIGAAATAACGQTGVEVVFGPPLPVLSWNACPDNLVAGYYVKYGTLDGMTTNAIDAGTNTRVQLEGLTPGTTHFIFVTAYDAQRAESDPSKVMYYCPLNAGASAPAPGGGALADPRPPTPGKTALTVSSGSPEVNPSQKPATAILRFPVRAGASYQVQVSRDLITWKTREILASGFTGTYAFRDPDPPENPARFYRVLASDNSLPAR